MAGAHVQRGQDRCPQQLQQQLLLHPHCQHWLRLQLALWPCPCEAPPGWHGGGHPQHGGGYELKRRCCQRRPLKELLLLPPLPLLVLGLQSPPGWCGSKMALGRG